MVAHECGPVAEAQTPEQLVLLFHGLGGSFQSSYIQRIAGTLSQSGICAVGVEARGCGEGISLARHHTHAGRSDDIAQVVKYFAGKFPRASIKLVAFSLSANTLLLLLGKWADEYPEQLHSAFVVSPPVDLVESSTALKQGLSRHYDYYFARCLLSLLKKRRQLNRNLADRSIPNSIETIWDFDEHFTAPIAGFDSALDYYQQSSANRVWNQIKLPTVVLHANDDPVVPTLPLKKLESNKNVRVVLTRHGGHLGYFSRPTPANQRWWMDEQIIRWVNDDIDYS